MNLLSKTLRKLRLQKWQLVSFLYFYVLENPKLKGFVDKL
jgi:hypothetical protein